jgi:hypothetical protein
MGSTLAHLTGVPDFDRMGRNRLSNVFVAHPVPNLASELPLSIPRHHLLSFIKVAHVETVAPPANRYVVRAGNYPLLTVGSNGSNAYGASSVQCL